jgi:lipoate-protein ligase A
LSLFYFSKGLFIVKWRLIPSSQTTPGGHMAYDAELFKAFQIDSNPILRFFFFPKPTFTLGRLEARRVLIDQPSFPYEIRPTGGRSVLHGEGDLCYAIAASKNDPLVGGTLIESYCKISKLIALGLQSLGRDIQMTTEKHLGLGDPHCFSAPSQAELTWNGKKVAGGAQAREGTAFLQQGVILLSVAEDWKKVFPASSVENMVGLNDDASLPVIKREQLEKALIETFEANGVQFK